MHLSTSPHGNILIITIIIILYLQTDQTADVAQTANPRSVAAAQDGYVVKTCRLFVNVQKSATSFLP